PEFLVKVIGDKYKLDLQSVPYRGGAPLMADTSLWFVKRRGIAVGIVASGNYMAGAIWPPLVRHWVDLFGWRDTMMGVGLFCMATMLPLALLLRRKVPGHSDSSATELEAAQASDPRAAQSYSAQLDQPFETVARGEQAHEKSRHSPESSLGISSSALLALLCLAGVACCVAMAMPQVHIVAYCSDLGFGAVKGAQMLSVMLAAGVVSRLIFGLISDRIGGLRTLLLGSVLQGLALLLFIPFQELGSLFIVSALFGLFQGGIVPAYAIIVLPELQQEFGVTRADASLPYTLTMVGFGVGGVLMGRLADRYGVWLPIILGGSCLGSGFLLGAGAASLWYFSLVQGLLVGML
ncbi:MAG: MFS transporter, partial [Betaproteobacteria bacterium]|nr:MFS transporter [Betaproteobacteria bacterium]